MVLPLPQFVQNIIDKAFPQAPEDTRVQTTREIIREHERVVEKERVAEPLPNQVQIYETTLGVDDWITVGDVLEGMDIKKWYLHNDSDQRVHIRYSDTTIAGGMVPVQANGMLERETKILTIAARRSITVPAADSPVMRLEVWHYKKEA